MKRATEIIGNLQKRTDTLMLVLGATVLALSLIILLGWLVKEPLLIQLKKSWAPMQFNTAVGFFLLGIATCLIGLRRFWWAAMFGGVAGVLGVITVSEYLFSWDAGIDTFFLEPFIVTSSFHPGRMSLPSATCFTLLGFSFLVLPSKKEHFRSFIFGICATITTAIATVAILGYLTNLDPVLSWGQMLSQMAAHAAFGFLILGGGISFYTLLLNRTVQDWTQPLILNIFLGVMTVTLCLWQALRHNEDSFKRQTVKTDLSAAARAIETEYHSSFRAVTRMAQRAMAREKVERKFWEEDAKNYIRDVRSLYSLIWVTKHGASWEVHADNYPSTLPLVASNLQDQYPGNSATTIFRVTEGHSRQSLMFIIPVFTTTAHLGTLVAFFDLNNFLANLFGKRLYSSALVLRDAMSDGFFRYETPAESYKELVHYTKDLSLSGLDWTLEASPSMATVTNTSSYLPSAVLAAGLLASLTASLLVFLLLKSIFNASSLAETSNRLGELQETLRTCLEAAQVGTWEWDPIEDRVTLGPNALKLLGTGERPVGIKQQETLWVVHEEDRERLEQDLRSALNEGKYFESRFRLSYPHAEIEWLGLRAEIFRDASGAAKRVMGVVWDITEMVKAEREVQEKNIALAKSNKELEQFAYIASHDLQAPLRTIASYIDLLKEEMQTTDPSHLQWMEFITNSVAEMRELINDLLTLARITYRKSSIQPMDLNSILHSIRQTVSFQNPKATIEIEPENLPTILGIPSQIKQLFTNLIQNSIKFTSKHVIPNIRIRVESRGDHWWISVQDNGIGIAPEHRERVFQLFQRLNTKEAYEGTGIGLSICKKIVEQHGGSIWVNEFTRVGTMICFTLAKRQTKEETSHDTSPRRNLASGR